ncbi:hypothetical protein [Natrinema pallidum]|uniref:hypothetical protein n=1 Tax=Natrinema pallidum TaxID=69527 RepID=UPI003751F3A2
MTANPFIELYEAPIETLTLWAYLLFLLAALIATWYLLTRNLLEMYKRWVSETWSTNTPLYPPGTWLLRAVAIPIILAIDLFLIAAFVYFAT